MFVSLHNVKFLLPVNQSTVSILDKSSENTFTQDFDKLNKTNENNLFHILYFSIKIDFLWN